MKKIVLATNNQGKVRELSQMLKNKPIDVVSQAEFNVSSVPETGLTFVENAIIKARHAALHTNLTALADDSGIEVDALRGEPGIYSARYAGENATDSDNLNKMLTALKDVPEHQRTARFRCVLVEMSHEKDPSPRIYQGTWEGRIQLNPQGDNGFGYDPIFFVAEYGCTSAELAPEIKNQLSHRGNALRLWLKDL